MKAKKDFVTVFEGRVYRGTKGEDVDMPKGARWVEMGLVEPAKKKPSRAVKKKKTTATKDK